MRAERLLVAIWSCNGAAVFSGSDRLRVEAPRGVLTPEVRDALAVQKADLLRLLPLVEEYRILLRSDVDDSIFLDAQTRLIDELGPVLATVVRRAAARDAGVGLRHA